MKDRDLELVSAALRTIGGNFDVPTLDLIFAVLEQVKIKGEGISIGDVRAISSKIELKYETNKKDVL